MWSNNQVLKRFLGMLCPNSFFWQLFMSFILTMSKTMYKKYFWKHDCDNLVLATVGIKFGKKEQSQFIELLPINLWNIIRIHRRF